MERPGGRTKEEANIHRTLQVSIAISVGATEAGKVAWSRWLNDGFGYWWVSSSGFSFFHNDGGHGQIIEAMLSLTLALVVLDLALEVGARMLGVGSHSGLMLEHGCYFPCWEPQTLR